MSNPIVREVFDKTTGSWQYIVADPSTSKAVIIDPVLNFDPSSGKVSTESADALLKVVDEQQYDIDMILETHAHADHLTAASFLQHQLGQRQSHKPLIGIGSRIKEVQKLFGNKYHIPPKDYENVFDNLWEDGATFHIGTIVAQTMHLPGHTPDHMGYIIGDNVFVGDSIFNSDVGSARADFPGGSAEAIYNSGRKLLALPDHTKIYTGHDYPPEGRDAPLPYMTVKQQKMSNKHLKDGTSQDEFVQMRKERDATLSQPRLMNASLQMNIRAGRLPASVASWDSVRNTRLNLNAVL
jgi:glyoxylase-like metal-dependent hydrolase (beta-lactamase superfamily II)